jgi:hypothetical protein
VVVTSTVVKTSIMPRMASSDSEESSQASKARDKHRRKRAEKYSSGDDDSSESDNDDIITLNQFSQMLLQSVQAMGILSAEQMRDLVTRIMKETKGDTEEEITPEFIQKKLDRINEAINPLNMTIRKVICEISNTIMYMFYATIESPLMKFQTSLGQYEVELFKSIMKVILGKEDFMAAIAELVKCGDEVEKLDIKPKTRAQRQKIVEKFIELKYLVISTETAEDQITLGIRAIREMQSYLQDTHKNIVGNCCLCKNLILNGIKCLKCDSDFHQFCFKSYVETTTQCPNPRCKTKLPDLEEMPKRTGYKPVDSMEEEGSRMDVENASGPDSGDNDADSG